jgi:riboflavin synthase
MFTGIVQKTAPIIHVERRGESPSPLTHKDTGSDHQRFRIATGFRDLAPGESIAVNGACLTVTEFNPAGDALFFISAETLACTALGTLGVGSRVNLERAMALGERLSGHIVQGHVDGLGRLLAVTPETESYLVKFALPTRLGRYCVEKGSIALNGVSLTINSIHSAENGPENGNEVGNEGEIILGITLIPHTWKHTQFADMHLGDPVHVEVDVLAKYVERLALPYAFQALSALKSPAAMPGDTV